MEARSPRGLHTRARLEQLASNIGVSYANQNFPRIVRQTKVSSYTQNDIEAGAAIAKQKRLQAFESKSHVFRRTPSTRGFKRDELYAAIEEVIRGNGSLGTLEYLLTQCKDVKTRKMLLFKSQTDPMALDMTDLLRLATEKRNASVIEIMAPRVDQWGLNSSLGLAVASLDLSCIRALLENGADPNSCHQQFIDAVSNGRIAVVEMLAGAEKKIETTCLDEALSVAISIGSQRLAMCLLHNGANANTEQVLETAVRAARLDLAAALVLANWPPSRISLDHAVGIAFQSTNLNTEEKGLLIELLLCAGANGDCTARALVMSVGANDEKFVSLIVSYNGSVTYNSCEAIVSAIKNGYFHLFDILLTAQFSPEAASTALSRIPDVATCVSHSAKVAIISQFVKRGACGPPLHECLIDSVRKSEPDLVEFLLANKASVDYNDGEAIRISISSDSALIKKLLEAKPTQTTLGHCIRMLPAVQPHRQHAIALELLSAGAKGEPVSTLLIEAIKGEFPAHREKLIELLVTYGADVNANGGKCFQESARLGDLVVLRILFMGFPTSLTLSRAITPAMQLRDRKLRFTVIELLLSSGATGPLVNQEFVSLLKEEHLDTDTVLLFLDEGKANVNCNNGEPIQQICRRDNPTLLNILLQHRASIDTVNAAFPVAIQRPDVSIRHEMCISLLDAGVSGNALDSSLVAAQSISPTDWQLLELLLERGANVNHESGTIIRRAIIDSNVKQLELFISKFPTTETLAIAIQSLVGIINSEEKYDICTILLELFQNRIPEVVDALFAGTIRLGTGDIKLLNLMLQHGASVDYQSGLAILNSIQTRRFDIFNLLLNQSPNQQTLETVFAACYALEGPERLSYTTRILQTNCNGEYLGEALLTVVQAVPCDFDMVRLLLSSGVSVHYNNHQCLVHSALAMDLPLLQILSRSISDVKAATYVFDKLIQTGVSNWFTQPGYSTLELLLSNGASGKILSKALVSVIEESDSSATSLQFVKLFLRYNADVNYEDGQALVSAVECGRPSLLQALTSISKPSDENIFNAFLFLFTSEQPESIIGDLLDVFFSANLDIRPMNNKWLAKEQHEQKLPFIFFCLKKWPRAVKVLSRLIEAGINPDKTYPYDIGQGSGRESVSLLVWALLKPELGISPVVIECLLKHGANPNFQSSISLMTPLLAATKYQPADITLKLIQHGADVSVANNWGATPLIVASCRGLLPIVRHLMKAGAPVNDGSLHEASRTLQPSIVQALIANGHHPNFRSTLHGGRSALAELCLKVSKDEISKSKLRQTIDALVSGRGDITTQIQGKSLLIHALDNQSSACLDVTTALLSSCMWKTVNCDFNLYVASDGHVFSPTTYVSMGLSKAPSKCVPKLIEILKSYGCKDVFYKGNSPQPQGMPHALLLKDAETRNSYSPSIQGQHGDDYREVASPRPLLTHNTHKLLTNYPHKQSDDRDDSKKPARRPLFLELQQIPAFDSPRSVNTGEMDSPELVTPKACSQAQREAELQNIRTFKAANQGQCFQEYQGSGNVPIRTRRRRPRSYTSSYAGTSESEAYETDCSVDSMPRGRQRLITW
ncbi:hypothetical protein FQN57_006515 [Myotisia sp. PD_48]|nr:hypothetical protein FQN57_006515 [Myotisia sp. PD_48]